MSKFKKDAREALLELIDERLREFTPHIRPASEEKIEQGKWSKLFETTLEKSEFKNFGEFCRTITAKVPDAKLRALVEQDDSQGGFLVPPEFSSMLMTETLENSIVMPRAKLFPMRGYKRVIPAVAITDHNGTDYPVYGGLTEEWTSADPDDADELWSPEGVDLAETEPEFRAMTLKAKKLAMYCKVSSELLEDTPGSSDILSDIFSGGMRNYMDFRFIQGSGTNMPEGVLNASCLYQQARGTASTIVWADIIGMLEHLHPASWANAVWLGSPSIIDQLYNMTTASSQIEGMQIFSEIDKAHQLTSLVGIPLIITEKMNALGSEGDFGLFDFSQYAIGIRSDIRFESSIHEHFRKDLVSFRAITRLDGQALWNKTCTLRDGTETSPFVVLQ